MGKVKVHELAKELNLSSKDIMDKANEIGIKITSHLNSIDEDQAEKIKSLFGKIKKSAKTNSDKSKKTDAETKSVKDVKEKKTSSPVIIRREVILSDDEDRKEDAKKEEKRRDVGFVERRNNEFNIVYRNKTAKPLTVNELFGIGKKETKPEKPQAVVKKELPVKEKPVENKPVAKTDTVAENHKVEPEGNVNKVNQNTVQSQNNQRINQANVQYRTPNNRPNYNNRPNDQERSGYNRNGNNNHFNNNYGDRNSFNANKNGFNKDGRNSNQFNNNRNNSYNSFANRNGNQNVNGDDRKNNNNRFGKNQRPLDNKKIDKKINDILETEIVEKENQRDYASRAIDKEKNNRYEEQKVKKATKSRKYNDEEGYSEEKLKNLKQVDRLSSMFNDQEGGMLDYYDLSTERGKRAKRKNTKKNADDRVKQKIFKLTEITIPEDINVKDLAAELKKTTGEVITQLMELGVMATINQELDFDTAFLIAEAFGVKAIKKEVVTEEDILFDDSEDKEEDLVQRPPVVVVMGHVDHGKTSLLDAIRKTNVIEGEAGGITQHIGAYKVSINGREITFLDTPGHEAFTSMRARGAQITDVAILIVAADDGVMPQTVEAINHAKAAEIPIIVAINKIDVPGANPDKVKQELMQYELVPEEWGGDTVCVEISAKKNINIDKLLEMVLLVSDLRDLKVNPKKQAKGAVIEARLDKAKGPVASLLVQRGELNTGNMIVVGTSIGRIRAMVDDKGKKIKSAGPSTPVVVMGLTKVPEAGETFYEVEDEKTAKRLIEKREKKAREELMNQYNKVTLDNLFDKMKNDDLKQLNIIVKADVQGTAEALKQSLEKLSDDEVIVRVIHSSVGAINESDVNLAKAGKAIIIGFNVRPNAIAKDSAEKLEVEIKLYSVIYQAIEDVEAAMNGLLDPIYEEKVIGTVEVRQTFKVSNVGTIAGGYVKNGRVERNAKVRVIRDDIVIFEGKLKSLKRFKDDVKEVKEGFECGLQIEGYDDIQEGDIIEVSIMEQVERKREKKK